MVNGDAQQHLKRLLSMGEGMRVEYKEAKNALPANLFETVCAMLNRDGGDILLGVSDDGQVIGIDTQHPETLKSNIVNLSNNPQKLDPPFILFPVERSLEGKTLLHLSIPASSQTHRSAGVVFDRSEDGDFRVNEPHRIAEISNRKRATYTENTIYPAATEDDLRLDMLPKLRNLMLARDPNHPWLSLTEEELMVKAGLYRKDVKTGKVGYTLAAILLLGKDETIHSAIPHYKIDALVRRAQVDRYDDRDRIECNLVDAYGRLMAFMAKHLPDPFFLEGDVRVSLRDKIFREVVANFLVHREYLNAHPARLTIYKDHVKTENASNYRTQGLLDPKELTPFSKNPTIAKFFAQLGWVEELGSGMVNIGKYLPLYSPGKKPEYRDGPVFTTVIPLPDGGVAEGQPASSILSEKRRKSVGKASEKILRAMSENNTITISELAILIGVTERTIERNIRKLQSAGLLRRIGGRKEGSWEVVE